MISSSFLHFFFFVILALFSSHIHVIFGGSAGLQLFPQERRFPIPKALQHGSKISKLSPRYKLNDTIVPQHYELELLVVLDDDPEIGEQFTAPGRMSIEFKPNVDSDSLTFHSHLLEIDFNSITLTHITSSVDISILGWNNETSPDIHFVTLSLSSPMKTMEGYKLYMEFIAPISQDRLNGLYLSTYTDPETGVEKRLLATQMESHHARQAFPCFDEPDLKATFNVTIIHKSNYTALANMELLETLEDRTRPGWVIDKFKESVRMSTYIFALTVSDFNYVEANPELFPGKKVRVYAPPHVIEAGGGNYSVDLSARLLNFYEEYYKAEYPLNKMDSVHIPQFSAGAMENWGLNLYEESFLIYYPGESLESERDFVTMLVAHELAHQNFGNLVTCNWWSQIWLNEGFATYISYQGVAALVPELRHEEWILNDAFQYSMRIDAGPDSHPLQQLNMLTPTEFDNIFTTMAITYQKGGSINRMTEKFLTKDTFHKGLRYYLQEKAFQTATSDDLFRNLDRAALEDKRLPDGLTTKDILDTWTLQKGHPLVRVGIASNNSIYISQERYTGLDTDNPVSLWFVPITLVTQNESILSNNIPLTWLNPMVRIKTQEVEDTSQWIMINQDATGYYRVLYDESMIKLIKEQLERNASVITPLSRSQLLDDYFNLAFLDIVDMQVAISLTSYLDQEDHFTVWEVIFTQLYQLYNLIGDDMESFLIFKEYFLPKLTSALHKIGFEESPQHIGALTIFRAKLLDWTCSMDYPACYIYSQRLYEQWQLDTSKIPMSVDTQGVLTCTMVAWGDKDVFNFIHARYKESPMGSRTKDRLLSALSCATDKGLIEDLLKMSLAGDEISVSEAIKVVQRLAGNPSARSILMTFIEEKTPEIINKLGEQTILIIIIKLSEHYSQEKDLIRLISYFEQNRQLFDPVLVSDSIESSIQRIKDNIKWMNKFGIRIIQSLKVNLENPTSTTIRNSSSFISIQWHWLTYIVGFLIASVYFSKVNMN